MRRGDDVIGSPIFAYDIGEKLKNKIEDLFLSQNSQQLLGFLVDEAGWTADALVLLLEQIDALGPDAVIIRSKDVLKTIKEIGVEQVLDQGRLRGSRLLTTDGRVLGLIVDICFDEQTGMIAGYEVSRGISDSYGGRAFVRVTESPKVGNQVVFVPASAVIEEHSGIKEAFQKTSEHLQKAALMTSEKLQSAAQAASKKVQEVVQQAQQRPSNQNSVIGKTVKQTVCSEHGTPLIVRGQRITPALAAIAQSWQVMSKLRQALESPVSDPIEQAKGKRVKKLVKSQEGLIIAAPDQIVDEAVIEKAQIYRQEQALLNAVGISVESKELGKIQRSWQPAQEQASPLPDDREALMVSSALGRPVKQNIFDKRDRLILKVGELITYQAIERAKQAGVLDVMLNAVYQKDY